MKTSYQPKKPDAKRRRGSKKKKTIFPAFLLDIQMGIYWASDIEIKRFKSSNSSTHTRLQLSWRIQSEKKSFWRTELQTNSGWNSSHGRILCFHTRYSNGNNLSFWYLNQAIQKPKFIYAFRNTNFMKDSKWDKIVLKNRIWPQSGWSKRVS